MALIDRLKKELGARNVVKYFPDESDEFPNANLVGYIAEGIEKFSEFVPLSCHADVTVNGTEVAIPAEMKKVSAVWNGSRYMVIAKEYDVYPGDSLFLENPEIISLLWTTDDTYPDADERKVYGEWMVDMKRRVVAFRVAGSGSVTLFGYGIPEESALNASQQREVLNFALGTALLKVAPTLYAKMDIDMEGVTVKQKTAEYVAEGSRLLKDFEANGNRPYMSIGG